MSATYFCWKHYWPKGSPFPIVEIHNDAGVFVAKVKGDRAKTLLLRLRGGMRLDRAMVGIL